jgi:tRNA dimethylallyltransferase
MSAQQQAWRDQKTPDPHLLRVALYPDRAWLHEKIALRFEQMLQAGFLAEVRALMQRPTLSLEHPSMRAVGYRQAWQHLQGEFDLAELRLRAVAATRQLAKRQITWIRSDPGILRLTRNPEQNFDALCKALIAYTTKPATM